MKNLVLIILLIIAFSPAKGQTSSNLDLEKKWQLIDGWFPEQNIQFIETKSDKSNNVFKFEEDGSVTYLGSLEGMSCDVGEFTMKDGNWNLEDNILTLELRGLKISDYWYWWIVKYRVKIEGYKMILEVKEIIKNREISPTKTWEELIKE